MKRGYTVAADPSADLGDLSWLAEELGGLTKLEMMNVAHTYEREEHGLRIE